ncbi:MAG: Exocyst complex component 5 [Trizodia sp. TS-e1964]|nr:MAG: Exocyst complex component 5 [Trizodia sp. TS-e1964]
MPTLESSRFLAKKPSVPPNFDNVDYDDTARLKQAQDAIVREQWVRSMMARLVREELGKCYYKEGVNHLEKCGKLRAPAGVKQSKDFIVKDFVESLTDGDRPPNRHSNSPSGAFDPRPLIRTFEHALRGMANLSEDLEAHESELLTSVRRAEGQHNGTLETLGKKLDQSINSFETLDISLNQRNGFLNGSNNADAGGTAAVKIGEKLEELDRRRRRALDAKFLIGCWLELSERGDLNMLEDVRRQGGGEGKVRCAIISRQLIKISQRLDPGSWPHSNTKNRNAISGSDRVQTGTPGRANGTRELLEKFMENLEKDLLKQFDEFYRRQNFPGMTECAKVLRDFNDGASVVGLFVNQHQFFIERGQLITEEVNADVETWDRLADPDTDPPGVEPSLQSLVDEVKVTIQEESFIIRRAFPYHEVVLEKFLQRIFQQSIQQRLEMVLDKASTISSLAFLRSLQSARSYINSLIDDLKIHGLTEHPEAGSARTNLILDQQFDELDASVERLNSSDLTPSQKTMLLRVAGIMDIDSSANKNEIEVTDFDGTVSIDSARRMLKWLAESVGRGLELSGGNEAPKDVFALLNLLLTNLGEIYVETALDSATDYAMSQESIKTEPDLSYLSSLRSITGIMHLMITFINTILIPLAASNLSVRREMEKSVNLSINRMEEKMSNVMHRSIDIVLTYVSKLLGGQKKTDFRPREGAQDSAQLQTLTCNLVITFVAKTRNLSSNAIDGNNLESFLAELAVGLRILLFDHFKKFQVNAAGGLVVKKDIAEYVTLLREFPPSPTFSISIEILHEIGNLFVIGPDALRERLKVGISGAEKADLKPFILRRDDYGSIGIQAILNSL